MKLSPDDQQAMDRMRPGVYSKEGFLGTDPRPLAEILDTDRSTLTGLGVTPAQIADRLEQILEQVVAAQGGPIEVADGVQARFYEAMGRIPCPLGDGVFRKGEIEMTTADGAGYCFTPLSTHMIREHGFFQGRGSRYRLEPDEVARTLGLVE